MRYVGPVNKNSTPERGWLALLNPRVWWHLMHAAVKMIHGVPDSGNGLLGLPADFLITPSGRALAVKYGEHAYDRWSVDVVLGRANKTLPHLGERP
jgi:hypothetical protein